MFRLSFATSASLSSQMEENKKDLKELVEMNFNSIVANIRRFEEMYAWDQDLKESEGKEISKEIEVKMERRLTRHRIEVEEMVTRHIAQGNCDLEHVFRDELAALERRLTVKSRSSSSTSSPYFTKAVKRSVRAADKREWKAQNASWKSPNSSMTYRKRQTRRTTSSSVNLNSVFWSSTSSGTSYSPASPVQFSFKNV